jgi:uroporphyrinogen-III synthase
VARAAASAGSAWLFSSSEAVHHLTSATPHTDWSSACAIATHPRIAASAKAAGFGRVIETRPALPDVLRALESNWSPT